MNKKTKIPVTDELERLIDSLVEEALNCCNTYGDAMKHIRYNTAMNEGSHYISKRAQDKIQNIALSKKIVPGDSHE